MLIKHPAKLFLGSTEGNKNSFAGGKTIVEGRNMKHVGWVEIWVIGYFPSKKENVKKTSRERRAHQHFVFSLLPLTVDSQTSFWWKNTEWGKYQAAWIIVRRKAKKTVFKMAWQWLFRDSWTTFFRWKTALARKTPENIFLRLWYFLCVSLPCCKLKLSLLIFILMWHTW